MLVIVEILIHGSVVVAVQAQPAGDADTEKLPLPPLSGTVEANTGPALQVGSVGP